MLREHGFHGPLGFFLHMPFVPPSMMEAMPVARELVADLCAYDLVGFQTEEHARDFRDCAQRMLGATVEGEWVRLNGRSHARLRRSDRHRRRRPSPGGRARGQRQAGAARRRQPGRPRAGDRRRPHGLFQGPAAALRGLWPPARETSRASPPDPLPADLPALARGGRRIPQAARRARPAGRPHQRPLLGVRLDAAALFDARRRRARPWRASIASPASAW